MTDGQATHKRRRKRVRRPPTDALDRASWLHNLLCDELYEIVKDDKLTDPQRREQVLKFAARITQSLPHHEIAQARDEVRGGEVESKGSALGGEVTRATRSGSRPLRATAPRRKG